jgi:hypothetical protein
MSGSSIGVSGLGVQHISLQTVADLIEGGFLKPMTS